MQVHQIEGYPALQIPIDTRYSYLTPNICDAEVR